MNDRAFFDTNIFVYAVALSDPRSRRARELITGGGKVSVQVLNEFVNVTRRRSNMPWSVVRLALENIKILCPDPLPVSLATHHEALAIAERYQYRFYDALIVASALEARCSILYSEGMQDGQVIEGRLTVRNPFRVSQ